MGEFSRIYKTDLSDRQLMAFWHLVQASGRARAIGYDRPAMDGPAFCRFLRRPTVFPWLVAWRGVPLALYYLTDLQGRSARVHFCFLPCGSRRVSLPAEAVPAALREARQRRLAHLDIPTEQKNVERAEAAPGRPENASQESRAHGPVRLPLVQAAALFGLASTLWEAPELGFRLDTLIGITPQGNAPALALVRSLGAKEHGTVPGLCWLHDARRNVPGLLTTFNREAVPQRAASI
jgi:hypothetical protein